MAGRKKSRRPAAAAGQSESQHKKDRRMRCYRVVSLVARLSSGMVRLAADQAQHRRHNLRPAGDGLFEVINPIEFKADECFWSDCEVNKAVALDLEELASLTEDDKPEGDATAGGSEHQEADA